MLSSSTAKKIGNFFLQLCGRCCKCFCLPCRLWFRLVTFLVQAVALYVRPAFIVFIAIAVGIWGEIFVYWQATNEWRTQIALHDEQNGGNTTIRLLLVADPQLVGERLELPVIGVLTRWDADRFLQKTFAPAFAVSQPHAVIFLGDLLDEGGISSSAALARYSRRFENIFSTRQNKLSLKEHNEMSSHKAEFLAYWGDNDLQPLDDLDPLLMDLYRERLVLVAAALGLDIVDIAPCRQLLNGKILVRHYDPLLIDSAQLYDQGCEDISKFKPAAALVQHLPSSEKNKLNNTSDFKDDRAPLFRILISHSPLVGPWSAELDKSSTAAVRNFAPHLVIAGHTHDAEIVWCDNCLDAGDDVFIPISGEKAVLQGDKPYLLPLPHPGKGDAPQPHIVVPTASYRMGTTYTGYGVITLNPSQHTMTFSVLWNPRRYPVLAIYGAVAALAALRLLAAAVSRFEKSDMFSNLTVKRTHIP